MKFCSSVFGHKQGCPQVREVIFVKDLASAQTDVDFPESYLDTVPWGSEQDLELVECRVEEASEFQLMGNLTAHWADCCSSGLCACMESQEHWLPSTETPIHLGLPSSCLCIMQPSGILIGDLSKLPDNFSNLLDFLLFLPNQNKNKLQNTKIIPVPEFHIFIQVCF